MFCGAVTGAGVGAGVVAGGVDGWPNLKRPPAAGAGVVAGAGVPAAGAAGVIPAATLSSSVDIFVISNS